MRHHSCPSWLVGFQSLLGFGTTWRILGTTAPWDPPLWFLICGLSWSLQSVWVICFVVLGIEFRALCVLCQHSTEPLFTAYFETRSRYVAQGGLELTLYP